MATNIFSHPVAFARRCRRKKSSDEDDFEAVIVSQILFHPQSSLHSRVDEMSFFSRAIVDER